MTEVVITKIPLRHFFYYQWLILGLHELKENKEITFTIRPSVVADRLFLWNYKIFLGLRKYFNFFRKDTVPEYLLKGYIISNGKRQDFCYDVADTPYYFDVDYLKGNVIYFKAQCPLIISKEGFELAPSVKIPYHPTVLDNKDKIYPSMLGPVSAYNVFSYKALLVGYQKLFLDGIKKTGTLMCYFGGNKGPASIFSYLPDLYRNESHILGFFGDKINHPNEKRGIATKLVREKGNYYDGRIIREFTDGAKTPKVNQESFIPLADYPRHISHFNYNLNISGFRKSIPFRFIYSFCVGTAIITDQLFVKWYQRFDKEVVETVEMGYLPNEAVDWEGFSQSIRNLPPVSANEVIGAFESKWAPKAFASYIVNTCIKKLN